MNDRNKSYEANIFEFYLENRGGLDFYYILATFSIAIVITKFTDIDNSVRIIQIFQSLTNMFLFFVLIMMAYSFLTGRFQNKKRRKEKAEKRIREIMQEISAEEQNNYRLKQYATSKQLEMVNNMEFLKKNKNMINEDIYISLFSATFGLFQIFLDLSEGKILDQINMEQNLFEIDELDLNLE